MAPAGQPATGRDRLIRRLCWAAAVLLLITHATLGWLVRTPAITLANDDAQYLSLAHSIRSLHYEDEHLVGSPINSQYPPVYPAALGATSAIFGDSLDVAHATTILFSVLALLILFDLSLSLVGPVPAVVVLAAVAFNNLLLNYAGKVATEAPYLALTFGTLWLITRFPATARNLLLAGLLAILAAMTRSIGVSLPAAVLLLWLLQRRFRAVSVFALASIVIVGGWLYWTTIAPDQFADRSYNAAVTSSATHFSGPIGLVVTRTQRFFEIYVGGSLTSGLEVPTIGGTRIDNAIWIVLILGLSLVGFWVLRKLAPIVPLYVLAYGGILLLYPFKLTRFLMPVEPLVVLAMVVGLLTLLRRREARTTVLALLLVFLPIVVHSIGKTAAAVRFRQRCDFSDPTRSTTCFQARDLTFFAAARYINATLPAGAPILTVKEAVLNYYSGHPVLHTRLAMVKGGKRIVPYLESRGVEYVLLSPYMSGFKVAQLLVPECRRFEVVKRFEYGISLVRLLPANQESDGSNACGLFTDLDTQLKRKPPPATVW
jgi:hypothetical protein